MTNLFLKLSLAAAAFHIGGCALSIPATYVDPKEITLPDAVKNIVCSLKTGSNEASRLNYRSGLLIDQAEATLQLKASATGTSTLAIDAKPAVPAELFASLGINYTDKTELVGSRDNTIKLTFKNMYTANLNNPGILVVQKGGPRFVDPRIYYPEEEPCNPTVLTSEDYPKATKINDPVRRR